LNYKFFARQHLAKGFFSFVFSFAQFSHTWPESSAECGKFSLYFILAKEFKGMYIKQEENNIDTFNIFVRDGF